MAIVRDTSGNSPQTDVDPRTSEFDSIQRVFAVTASDTVNLPNGICEALNVTTAGAYKVTFEDDTAASPYLAAGIWHPMRVKRVWSTGSVATVGILAGY